MARNTNNELAALPGFFFYPRCADGLEELTNKQRFELLLNQGIYAVGTCMDDPKMEGDLLCAVANGRIPTHRRPGTEFPAYGKVPLDLRAVIDLKGME